MRLFIIFLIKQVKLKVKAGIIVPNQKFEI